MNYIKDVSLYNDDETTNVVIEILEGTSDKNELVEPFFNKLICVRQVNGKYPFYYGSFPQTLAGDKDPLDMILFTDKPHNLLDLVKVDVIGAVRTIDAGEQDDKIICVEASCGLSSVKKQMKKAMKFLKIYKGRGADMSIEKKLASMAEAEELIAEAHNNFKEQQAHKMKNSSNSSARIRVIQK
jgi:inorganic pyrophosphatase